MRRSAVFAWVWLMLACASCFANVYPMQCGVNHGTATHIGDGVLLTCKHCFDGVNPDGLTVAGHDAELLRLSEDSDLATLYCEALKDARGYVPAPDGYEVEVGSEVTARGYVGEECYEAKDRVLRYLTVNSDRESEATQVECNFTVRSGMSGGAIIDSNGYLVGIINGNTVETRVCFATCTRSFWRVVYRVPAYHPWRPVLHVWTSNHCGPCHQFWEDFVSDPEFRAAIEANFRLPRNPDGTVNQMAYNVDAHRALARSWGVNVVPTFGTNPANRVSGYGPASNDDNCPPEARGMDRKGYLLWRLGLIVRDTPQPQPPATQEPTPAVIESTGPCVGCAERFTELGGRLTRMESRIESLALEVQAVAGRTPPAFDDTELRDRLAALEAELAAMRTAELTVNLYQPNGNVQTGTVRIFDPDDSLDLNFSRVSP